jgi:DNA topoisomerase-1
VGIQLLVERGKKQTGKELGVHPDSGVTLKLLSGRYGPYVTDGTVNASLPKGAKPEDITLEKGIELLAERGKKSKRGARRAGKGSSAKPSRAKRTTSKKKEARERKGPESDGSG